MMRGGDHRAFIAVRDRWQRRGLADVMLRHMLAVASTAGVPEARALIASSNQASLRLHQRAGFSERARRAVWQRCR
jgi:L-amino acid N-acyltransferase YncA